MNEVTRLITVSMKRLFSAPGCISLCVNLTYALGQKQYVEFAGTPGALPLVARGVALPILADSQDFPGVLRAARDLQKDIARVTSRGRRKVSDARTLQSVSSNGRLTAITV